MQKHTQPLPNPTPTDPANATRADLDLTALIADVRTAQLTYEYELTHGPGSIADLPRARAMLDSVIQQLEAVRSNEQGD